MGIKGLRYGDRTLTLFADGQAVEVPVF